MNLIINKVQVKIINTYWKESIRYKDSFLEQLAHELESKQYNYKESLIIENDNS
jgi:glucan phosphoethanolaminetransferase (alkaline phosphatase superfamily)